MARSSYAPRLCLLGLLLLNTLLLLSLRTHRFEFKDIMGHVHEFALDQHGSRFIQQVSGHADARVLAHVRKRVHTHHNTQGTQCTQCPHSHALACACSHAKSHANSQVSLCTLAHTQF